MVDAVFCICTTLRAETVRLLINFRQTIYSHLLKNLLKMYEVRHEKFSFLDSHFHIFRINSEAAGDRQAKDTF